jgi:pSer/pThr/pTyr-binding forkhead associated (FHA) protein
VSGRRFSFEDVARIGRDGQNEVAIAAPTLARLHATISFSGGTFWLEDAGSPAGTFLNAKRITKERLYHLDVLGFGSDVELVFLARASSDTGAREGLVNARLVAIEGPEAGSAREIPKGTFTVGRAAVCNLVIESAAVSKTHARLERTNNYLMVTDLGSANGTFVNGVRITNVPLANGDRILFAAAREFRVEIDMGDLPSTESSVEIRTGVGERKDSDSQMLEMATNWKSRYDFAPPVEAGAAGEVAKTRESAKLLGRSSVGITAKQPLPKPPQRAPGQPAPKPAPPAGASPKPAPPAKAAPVAKAAEKPGAEKPAQERPAAPKPPADKPAAEKPTAPQTGPPPAAKAAAPPPAAAPASVPAPPSAPVKVVKGVTSVVLKGDLGSLTFGEGRHLFGRGEGCAVTLASTKASRQHAALEIGGGTAVVHDLASANGTYVNGQRLTAPHTLKDGETVTFGDVAYVVTLKEG